MFGYCTSDIMNLGMNSTSLRQIHFSLYDKHLETNCIGQFLHIPDILLGCESFLEFEGKVMYITKQMMIHRGWQHSPGSINSGGYMKEWSLENLSRSVYNVNIVGLDSPLHREEYPESPSAFSSRSFQALAHSWETSFSLVLCYLCQIWEWVKADIKRQRYCIVFMMKPFIEMESWLRMGSNLGT